MLQELPVNETSAIVDHVPSRIRRLTCSHLHSRSNKKNKEVQEAQKAINAEPGNYQRRIEKMGKERTTTKKNSCDQKHNSKLKVHNNF